MDKSMEHEVKGLLRVTILRLIHSRGTVHGYAIIKEIREKTGVYLGPSTVYPLLIKLEREGLLTSSWKVSGYRPNKGYTITSRGVAILQAESRNLEIIVKSLVLAEVSP